VVAFRVSLDIASPFRGRARYPTKRNDPRRWLGGGKLRFAQQHRSLAAEQIEQHGHTIPRLQPFHDAAEADHNAVLDAHFRTRTEAPAPLGIEFDDAVRCFTFAQLVDDPLRRRDGFSSSHINTPSTRSNLNTSAASPLPNFSSSSISCSPASASHSGHGLGPSVHTLSSRRLTPALIAYCAASSAAALRARLTYAINSALWR
jgi:hypothetical protein